MNLSMNKLSNELIGIFKGKSEAYNLKRVEAFNQYSKCGDENVQDMLAALDPDMPYDDWLRVGMALHSGGYDLGIWDKWSACGSKYKAGECKNKWQGFNGTAVSMASLKYMAIEKGWKAKPFQKQVYKENYNASALQLYHWSDLYELPRRKYLVKGWLDKGGMSVVYGASNSGKTFVALDIACHIALGWDWRDMRVRQGSVVYIAGEGGLGIQERLTAFKQHYDLEGFADIYVIPTNVCLCKDETAHGELLQRVEFIPNIKLIIIDTLARAMGSGDENSSSDMGSFVKHCDIIRQTTGTHVMVIHHSGKEESRGARGHSSLKAAVDTEINVVQRSGVIKASITKQREGDTGQELGFKLIPYEVRRDEDGEPVYSCVLADVKQACIKNDLRGQARDAYEILLELMGEGQAISVELFRQHCLDANLCKSDNRDSSDKAFKRALVTLQNKGLISEVDGCIELMDNKDKLRQTKN